MMNDQTNDCHRSNERTRIQNLENWGCGPRAHDLARLFKYGSLCEGNSEHISGSVGNFLANCWFERRLKYTK